MMGGTRVAKWGSRDIMGGTRDTKDHPIGT